MITIKIMNEFMHGPIWTYNSDGDIIDTIKTIQDSDEVKNISDQIETMYNEYFEFNVNDAACIFDEEHEKKDKQIMIELIEKLKLELSKINDGSFIVIDEESPRLNSLCQE